MPMFNWNDSVNFFQKMTLRRAFNAMKVLASYHVSRWTKKSIQWGYPISISFEPTTSCNLRCPECPSGLRAFSRPTGMLKKDFFRETIDQLSKELMYLVFYFQGEPYLNPDFLDMVQYATSQKIYTATSTNAHYLNDSNARRTVESGLDRIIISIDGTTQETYAQYRKRGDFDKAIRNLAAAADEKRQTGRDLPFINWRYILFNHNDSDEEMSRARRMAGDMGVDRLCWELTDHPEDMYSRRFAPGSEALAAIRHEIWDDNNLGNAIPGATPRARIDVRGPVPGLPLLARAGRPLTVRMKVRNLSSRPFPAQASYGRRLVRVGAQLCARDGGVVSRDFERAWLPRTLSPETSVDVEMTLTAPAAPGRYGLKFDLVSEGIDWFEACGSETTTKTLVVF